MMPERPPLVAAATEDTSSGTRARATVDGGGGGGCGESEAAPWTGMYCRPVEVMTGAERTRP